MEYDITNTEQWFLERAGRKNPKRLKKIPPFTKPVAKRQGNAFRNTRTGWREDIKETVRSGWEGDFLRVLKSYSIEYQYEPFILLYPIKRGNKSYLPDFYLPNTDEIIEIKGFFSEDSRIKVKRFAKYYPEEFANYTMIINKGSKKALQTCRELGVPNILFWQDIAKIFHGRISNWESK